VIYCIQWHSESDRVFSWGHSYFDIEGVSLVLISNEISIKKISCDLYHSILLSRDEDIYWFGFNVIEKLAINEFIDIESHYN
jgi:alpha-tubulin suppressor-like RCC1 family protein